MKITKRITAFLARPVFPGKDNTPETRTATEKTSTQKKQIATAVRSFDAASSNRHLNNHFALADPLDINSQLRVTRKTLRNRTRYEIANNGYAKGMTMTKAIDTIGTGPRVQFECTDKNYNEEYGEQVEEAFIAWCGDETDPFNPVGTCDKEGMKCFAEILDIAGSMAEDDAGESLIILQNAKDNGRLNRHRKDRGVRLRLLVIEADRLVTPMGADRAKVRDGIEYDDEGRPAFYYILKKHPGDMSLSMMGAGMFGDYDRVPAREVIHFFRHERAEQKRGVPGFSVGTPLYASLRRYTKATNDAAETAANLAGVMHTTNDELDDEESPELYDVIEIERNSMLTLPEGWDMRQFKPEQPTTTYKEFKGELVNELGRGINMPYNVAAGNSSGYNYASGRLDWQLWYRTIKKTRSRIERHILNRVFAEWYREARLIPGLFGGKHPAKFRISWMWPGNKHADPVKNAVANDKDLKNNITTLADLYAEKGQDWRRKIKQRAKEIQLLKQEGLLDEKDTNEAMANIARAVRSGVPVAVAEARTSIGLPQEPPDGKLLRFNDQDVLQYHIECGILTINEVREVLRLKAVSWGNGPVQKTTIGSVDVSKSGEGDEKETDEDTDDGDDMQGEK